MFSPLRTRLSYANVVASIALFIALGGVSYGLATGSIGSREIRNNAIRSGDIRNNDIRSKDLRDHSLLAKDFKAGQLPSGPAGDAGPAGAQGQQGLPGPTFAAFRADGDPVASPDSFATSTDLTVNLPAAGRLMAVYTTLGVIFNCSSGDGTWGLYVDSVPVPGTLRYFTSGTSTGAVTIIGVTANSLPAGNHLLQLGFDCTSGNVMSGSLSVAADLGGVLLSG